MSLTSPVSFRALAAAVLRDVRHAFRLMRRDPAFTLAAVATLALGIGLNTAIFSVAYGVLWRPLPYPDADRLVMISSVQQTDAGIRPLSTWPSLTYEGMRTRVTTLDGLAAYNPVDAELTGRGEPLQVPALEVSANFFTTLGTDAALGRTFLDDATSTDDRSAVVSDHLWRTSFGADPAALGQPIIVDGVPRTIAGVLPPEFTFRPVIRNGALPDADVFLPYRSTGDPTTGASLFLLGRMTPGVTRPRAEAELTSLLADASLVPAGALTQAGTFDPDARTLARISGLQEYGTEQVRVLLLVLLGAVSFVLLIACVNVANLQMARLVARRGELSIRMALGAGRRRIVFQLLTEAVVLSLVGAAAGLLLAHLSLHLTLPLVPSAILPRADGVVIDTGEVAFSGGLVLASTLLIGLVPALRIGGATFGESRALHAGEVRTTGDRHGERLRTWLVAAQVAMTLVLLIGAGLLIHSFLRLTSVSPGFESSGAAGVVQTVRVVLPERLYDEPERSQAFARDLLERIRYLPGVAEASVINSAPFGMMFIQGALAIEGQPPPTISPGMPKIEPGYFRTMGIPLLAGRDFTVDDTAGAPKVAIVSERIVREHFPGGPAEALGRRVRLGIMSPDGDWLTIVGVVADVRQHGLDQDVKPMVYTPFQQERDAPLLLRFVSFVVRTATPARVAEGIRAEIRRAAPDLPIAATVTMDEAVAASAAAPRFRTVMLGLFATAAMLIAACGLYGLMAYAVTQRRREIGVRMALGATRGEVLRLVLTRALRIVVAGLVVGLVGAAGLTRVLQSFLFGVTPTDPVVFTGVTLLLLAVGLLSAWLPARRATRIDPWAALRSN